MTKKYRIGVLGLTHDHVWSNLHELQQIQGGEVVAAADPHPELRKKIQEQYGCKVYPSGQELLEAEQLNAVYVYGDNAAGVAFCTEAAARGLHILIEKPIAANLSGADEILAAVRQNGVRLMVNWPFAWWPQLQHALHLTAGGEIGAVWQVKYRAAHAGPKELGCSTYFCDWLYDRQRNGGGALIDYCCYGAALARTVLGVPHRVSATAGRLCKEDITVEDNALIVMSYPRAMAIAEASWTQIGKMTSYIAVIYGTKGTMLVEPREDGRLLLATVEHPDGIRVEIPEPRPERRNASNHFIHCLETGEAFLPLCQDRIGRDAQEILEAALQTVETGSQVSLPLR